MFQTTVQGMHAHALCPNGRVLDVRMLQGQSSAMFCKVVIVREGLAKNSLHDHTAKL